jgi:hypothetical protein
VSPSSTPSPGGGTSPSSTPSPTGGGG